LKEYSRKHRRCFSNNYYISVLSTKNLRPAKNRF